MLIALALALAPADEPLNLQLLCTGTGSQDKTASDGDPNHNANYTEAVIDDVRIDLNGSTGRIRIPRTMLPPLRGGKDGWFELHDVVVTRDEITAAANLNLIDHAKVRLSRLNGTLSLVKLHGRYYGRCQPFTDTTTRVF